MRGRLEKKKCQRKQHHSVANKVHHSYYCNLKKKNVVSFMPNISVLLHLFTVQSYSGRGKSSLNCTSRWTRKERNTWEQSPELAPKQICDWHLTREKLPLCGAYFPAAAWRSGYAKGGRHSWWRTSQSELVYLQQSSTPAVQGGRVSEEEARKRNKQMQTCDIIYF